MAASPSFWSTSAPEENYSNYPFPNYVEGQQYLNSQFSSEFQGEDLEVILSDSEDQLRASPPSKRGKKKKSKPPPRASHSYPLPYPSSVSMSDKVLGQMAPKQQLFCPFQAVSKYPYRHVKGSESEAVSKAYFAGGKLRARGWSIYYIHTTLASVKPLLMVPAIEFRALLAEINGNLDLQLKFPDDPGFLLSFLENGSPRPRYLGCLSTETPLEVMASQMPGPDFKLEGEDEVDPRSLEAFRAKIEAAMEAVKNRSKGSKEKKKKARVMEKKGCCLQLRRTQRYLGMKPILIDPLTEVLEWRELEEASKKHEEALAKSRQVIDMMNPVPYPFHQEVIFIAIDVEWYERSNKTITEIGISTLDTRNLLDIAPGAGCLAWMDQIRARHFRIREHSHLINSDFVTGCGDRFEAAFGTSEWISLAEAPRVVASCFRFDTASAPDDSDSSPAVKQYADEHSRSSSFASVSGSERENDDGAKPKHNIVLVGHDIKTDIDHLRAMGFDLSNMSNILEIVDTADIFRALKHEQQPRSLGAVLLDLGLTGWNLHNAGNDAAYTLQAMLGISFKALDVSRERRAAIAAARAIRIEAAAKDAQQHVREDCDEWDMVDVEENDGAASAPPDAEPGRSTDRAGGRAEVDGKRKAQEKGRDVVIEEAEAERLALAAGDDIGGGEAGHTMVERRVLEAEDIPIVHDNGIEAADRPASNRNSHISSVNVGGSDKPFLSDNDEDVNQKDNRPSPLDPKMADRLRFLDNEDGEEEGGVKI